MNVRKIIFLVIITLGLSTLMSSSCKKDEPNDPSSCNEIASATATESINQSFCFNTLVSYNYVAGESLSFVCRQDGDPIYSLQMSINPINGPGQYNISSIDPGYVELDIHGDDNEYYKSESGSITITQVDETHFKATFNALTTGYYNGKTVNITGTINK